MNFLLMESMQRINYYYGDEFQVEFPTGSGQKKNLWDAASDLARRLSTIFLRRDGRRAVFGDSRCCRTILTGAITFSSTNILTGIRRTGLARAIRPGGPRWLLSCWSRAGNSSALATPQPVQRRGTAATTAERAFDRTGLPRVSCLRQGARQAFDTQARAAPLQHLRVVGDRRTILRPDQFLYVGAASTNWIRAFCVARELGRN